VGHVVELIALIFLSVALMQSLYNIRNWLAARRLQTYYKRERRERKNFIRGLYAILV